MGALVNVVDCRLLRFLYTTSCRELFITYKSGNLKIVKIGNYDKSLVGMRNMHVMISLNHNLILKNIRHVPSLRVYLLSLNKLDEIDYNSQFTKSIEAIQRNTYHYRRGKM